MTTLQLFLLGYVLYIFIMGVFTFGMLSMVFEPPWDTAQLSMLDRVYGFFSKGFALLTAGGYALGLIAGLVYIVRSL